MNESAKERYSRWQEYRIQHLSFSINLFIGLSVASMGFASKEMAKCSSKEIVLLFFAASLVAGILATVSRLIDFRYTAKGILEGENKYKSRTYIAGKMTWIFFGVELGAYIIAAYYLLFDCML